MPDIKNKAKAPTNTATLDLPEIKGFIETSFLDWPGMISSVLFLPHCNFSCPFCHNFQLIKDPKSLATLPFEWVMERLTPFIGWIDGVVLTGGEPTLHAKLPLLIEQLKSAGFAVKLDTNGTNPKMVEDLVQNGLVDMVAMDVKAPLEDFAYRRATGTVVDLDKVRRSIEYLKSGKVKHQFRSTIWPLWHKEDELKAMAQDVKGAQAWTLQILNPETAWNPEALGQSKPYLAEEIKILQEKIADPVCL